MYGVQKWHCEVRIDEHPKPFPGPSGGLINGAQPSFARKKDAKKYAAKCAVEWLRENGYIIHNGGNDVRASQPQEQPQEKPVTPQPTPAKKKQKVSPPTPERPQASTSTPESNGREIPPGTLLPKGPTNPFDEEEVTAVQEVSRLCKRLGLKGEPQYRITRMAEGSEFYKGYADLGMLSSQIPVGAGFVNEVFGKKPCKEKIAEELLEPLRNLAARFDEQDQKFRARQARREEEDLA